MHNIHFFGKFRKFAKEKGATDNSIIYLDYVYEETVSELLSRLDIDEMDCGEIFINHNVVELDAVIENDNSRIAIFPIGMHLLCGGQHLKGHGFIAKHPTKKTNYW